MLLLKFLESNQYRSINT